MIFFFFGYILRSETAESSGSSIFNFFHFLVTFYFDIAVNIPRKVAIQLQIVLNLLWLDLKILPLWWCKSAVKPYFKIWILIFSRASNMQLGSCDAGWQKQAVAPSQVCDNKGKQLIHCSVVLNAFSTYHIYNLRWIYWGFIGT